MKPYQKMKDRRRFRTNICNHGNPNELNDIVSVWNQFPKTDCAKTIIYSTEAKFFIPLKHTTGTVLMRLLTICFRHVICVYVFALKLAHQADWMERNTLNLDIAFAFNFVLSKYFLNPIVTLDVWKPLRYERHSNDSNINNRTCTKWTRNLIKMCMETL